MSPLLFSLCMGLKHAMGCALHSAHCGCVGLREPEGGLVEILKLVGMGLVWGVLVLGVIHLSMWLGAWWDNNIGTPGKPGWRSQRTFQ